MYQTVQQCQSCGAGLTLDDMRRTQCPYCQVVYPHHSQAAQHAQVAGMMMNQMIAQAGYAQNPYAPPPLGGGPPGGPPPGSAPPGAAGAGLPGAGPPVVVAPPSGFVHAYGNPAVIATQQARAIGRGIVIAAIVSSFAILGLVVVGLAVAFVLFR